MRQADDFFLVCFVYFLIPHPPYAILLCVPLGCDRTAGTAPPSDPSYDHQHSTYHAKHKPLRIANADLRITPFFSPDHSMDTMVEFIQGAKSKLDIITPSLSSWSHCSSVSST